MLWGLTKSLKTYKISVSGGRPSFARLSSYLDSSSTCESHSSPKLVSFPTCNQVFTCVPKKFSSWLFDLLSVFYVNYSCLIEKISLNFSYDKNIGIIKLVYVLLSLYNCRLLTCCFFTFIIYIYWPTISLRITLN